MAGRQRRAVGAPAQGAHQPCPAAGPGTGRAALGAGGGGGGSDDELGCQLQRLPPEPRLEPEPELDRVQYLAGDELERYRAVRADADEYRRLWGRLLRWHQQQPPPPAAEAAAAAAAAAGTSDELRALHDAMPEALRKAQDEVRPMHARALRRRKAASRGAAHLQRQTGSGQQASASDDHGSSGGGDGDAGGGLGGGRRKQRTEPDGLQYPADDERAAYRAARADAEAFGRLALHDAASRRQLLAADAAHAAGRASELALLLERLTAANSTVNRLRRKALLAIGSARRRAPLARAGLGAAAERGAAPALPRQPRRRKGVPAAAADPRRRARRVAGLERPAGHTPGAV